MTPNSAQIKPEMAPSRKYGVPQAVVTRMKEVAISRTQTSETIESPDPIPVVDYNDIKLEKTLGTGGFSSAYRIQSLPAVNEKAEDQPVMKKLRPEVLQNPLLFAACAADLELEGRILGSLDHPNIIGLRAWSGPQMIEKYLQGSKASAYLILDQLVGTLEDRLAEWAKKKPKFYYSKKRKASLLKSVQDDKSKQVLSLARALEHLHGYHILHRDIKPANIGFDVEGILKIFDFDLARVLPLGRDRLFQLTCKVGSPRYMAPEVKRGDKYNLTADVFSFGVVAYEIFTHKKFNSAETMECDWSKKNKKIPSDFSTELRTVLQQCLAETNTNRPHMDKVRRTLKAEIDENGFDLSDSMGLSNLNLDSSALDLDDSNISSRMLPSAPSSRMLPSGPSSRTLPSATSAIFKSFGALDEISRSENTSETEAETVVFSEGLPSSSCPNQDPTNTSGNNSPVLWV